MGYTASVHNWVPEQLCGYRSEGAILRQRAFAYCLVIMQMENGLYLPCCADVVLYAAWKES